MLGKDYPRELRERFAGRYAEGATVTMLQKEFGLPKSSVKSRRERMDEGGAGAIDRPGKNKGHSQEFKIAAVEAFIEGEGDCRELARRFGVRNSAQTRDRVKRYLDGGEDALSGNESGRKRRPQGLETVEERCARLESENEIPKRMAASAAALSETGGSARS